MRIRRKSVLVVLAGRLFQLSTRAFSPDVRDDYGPEMRAAFSRIAHATMEADGAGALGLLLWRSILDVLVSGLAGRIRSFSAWHQIRAEFRGFFVSLLRAPLPRLFATVILTVGAISALTVAAIVSTIHNGLPFEDAERLVLVRGTVPERNWLNQALSLSELDELSRASSSFERVAGFTWSRSVTVFQGLPTRQRAAFVTPEYFEIHSARPFLGSLESFEAAESQNVVALSYAYWNREMGGDSSVVGDDVNIGGLVLEVAAVLPKGFDDIASVGVPHRLWMPVGLASSLLDGELYSARTIRQYIGLAVLNEGVTLETARREADRVAAGLAGELTGALGERGYQLLSAGETILAPLWQPARVLSIGAFTLLLLCGFNVASLTEFNSFRNRSTLAVRLALGASRGSLARQAFFEAMALTTASTVVAYLGVGAVLAAVSTHYSLPVPSFMILADAVPPLWAVAGVFVINLSLIGAFAVISGLRCRVDVVCGGERTATARSPGAWKKLLVGLHAVFATMLILLAGLVVRSLDRLSEADLGFETDHLVTMRLDFDDSEDRSNEQPAGRAVHRFSAELQAFVNAGISGVVGAGVWAPNTPGNSAWHVVVGWAERGASERCCTAAKKVVSPGAVEAVGITLRAGRLIESGDTTGADDVAVIDTRLAEELWPGVEAVGKSIHLDQNGGRSWRIVGVVDPVRSNGRWFRPDLHSGDVYLSLFQYPVTEGAVVIREDPGMPLSVAAVTDWMRGISREVTVFDGQRLTQALRGEEGPTRLLADLLGFFAVIAVCVALISVYGVVAGSIALRSRELALKTALGAPRLAIWFDTVGVAAVPALVGMVLGLFSAAALSPAIQDVLYETSPFDPGVFVLGIGLVGFATFWAIHLPARRTLTAGIAEILGRE